MKDSPRLLVLGLAIALASLSVRADVTVQWTSIAAETLRHAQEGAVAAERSLAAVRHAMTTARSSENGNGNGNGNGHGGSAAESQRRDAAVAVAAFAVLETLYPAQREALETQLAVTFSHIPETAAKAEGAAQGRRIAKDVLGGMER